MHREEQVQAMGLNSTNSAESAESLIRTTTVGQRHLVHRLPMRLGISSMSPGLAHLPDLRVGKALSGDQGVQSMKLPIKLPGRVRLFNNSQEVARSLLRQFRLSLHHLHLEHFVVDRLS